MTLEEKVAQIGTIWNNKDTILKPDGTFDPAKASAQLPYGIGQDRAPRRSRRHDAHRPVAATRARRPRWSTTSSIGRSSTPGSAFPSCSTKKACTAPWWWTARAFRRPSRWPALGSRSSSAASTRWTGPRARRARHRRSARAGGRRGARSALGPHRGDLRRGSLSRRRDGRRGDRGPAGRCRAARLRQGGVRDAQAHDRPRPSPRAAPMSAPRLTASARCANSSSRPSRKRSIARMCARSWPSYNEIDGVPSHVNTLAAHPASCAANGATRARW